jgi:hypothetical protein
VPLQGDDSHLHTQNVQRGPDGKGKYALKCANCHQDANLPGENMAPGNPNWHLPPPAMRMVVQGKSPGEFARQLTDPKLNGGKTLEQILHHVTNDKLVAAGWDPGDGHTEPPHEPRRVRAADADLDRKWSGRGLKTNGQTAPLDPMRAATRWPF